MKKVTQSEEMILLTIWNLKENAYLVSIKKSLSDVTGKNWSIGSVHIPLMRLEKAGYLESEFGDATSKRGGRRKRIYNVTQPGFEALRENKRVSNILWSNFPETQTDTR